MKSLHFCTPLLLNYIRSHMGWESYRTGWMPEYVEGDVIQINDRISSQDEFMCYAKIMAIQPIRLKDIPKTPMILEEIGKYDRPYSPLKWFLKTTFHKCVFQDLSKFLQPRG